jgi:hypothetical protein
LQAKYIAMTVHKISTTQSLSKRGTLYCDKIFFSFSTLIYGVLSSKPGSGREVASNKT